MYKIKNNDYGNTIKTRRPLAYPRGCKAVIDDGVVVFEKEDTEFKDGDIVSVTDYWGDTDILILKYRDAKGFNYYYIALSSGENLVQKSSDEEYWGNITPVLATDEEKQLLFDAMAEKGLKWNAEEKCVEKIRWRSCRDQDYYSLGSRLNVIQYRENFRGFDDEVWDSYNYFRTQEQTEKAAEVVKEALRKFHEENG